MNVERLHDRVREIRVRSAIRAWELRQCGLARGVWFRLERMLACSRRVAAIAESDADELIRAGHEPLPIGAELHPPRRIFVVHENDVPRAPTVRELAIQDGGAILSCTALVLVPFDGCEEGVLAAGRRRLQ